MAWIESEPIRKDYIMGKICGECAGTGFTQIDGDRVLQCEKCHGSGPERMNEIEKFISDFRDRDEKALTKIFTEDYCYHFSVILKAVFRGGIFYDVVQGHFLFEFEGKFYDITGKVEPGRVLIPFDELSNYDSEVFKRIIRDCVLKVE